MAVAFLIGVRYGIVGVCLAWILAYPGAFFFTCLHNLRTLGLPIKQYLSEMVFPVGASVVMVSIVFMFKKMVHYQPLFSLAFLTTFGMVSYVLITLIFKKEDFLEMKKLLQR